MLESDFLEQLRRQAMTSTAEPVQPNADNTNSLPQTQNPAAPLKPFVDAFTPNKRVTPTMGVPPSEGSVVGKLKLSSYATPETPVRMSPDISIEDQTKIYGGPVGSPAYWAFKEKAIKNNPFYFAGQQINSQVFGMQYPDMTTWDKMTTGDKISQTAEQLVEAPIKLIMGAPQFLLKAVPSLANFASKPLIEGTLDPAKLAASEQTGGFVNKVTDPIYTPAYDAYKNARATGHSEAVSTIAGFLQGGVEILNRGLVGAGIYQATKSLIVPPKKLSPGEIINPPPPSPPPSGGSGPEGSPSIYYSHAGTSQAELKTLYNVKGGRIFTKITPAGEGTVEISVVQVKDPLITSIKNKIGLKDQKLIAGKLGPETKLDSTIVKVNTTEALPKVAKSEPLAQEELSQTLRGTQGLTAEDIMSKHPDIQLKRDVPATDIYGNKVKIPEGEALTPYELKGNKILLQDGEIYVVSKNQFQNIKGQSVSAEAKPFAPELQGLEETIMGSKSGKLGEVISGKDVIGSRPPKFSRYQLPRGKNYKEISYKSPNSKVPAQEGHPEGDYWIRMNERDFKGQKAVGLEELQKNKNLDNFPDHPLAKGKWIDAGVKSFLKKAVDDGADIVYWTTGEQQVARYNISDKVDSINWGKPIDLLQKSSKVKSVSIRASGRARGEDMKVTIDESGKIVETLRSTPNDWKGKNINSVLPKGVVDEIIGKESGNLSGEGLNIGGQQLRNYYDNVLKNKFADITGGKVEVLDMGLPIDAKYQNIIRRWEDTFNKNPLKPAELKTGLNLDINDIRYVVTNVLGDGKFEAVPKSNTRKIIPNDLGDIAAGYAKRIQGTDLRYNPTYEPQTFDISSKTTTQQGIKLTPEIKAKIRGEAPKIKTSGEQFAPEMTKSQLTDFYLGKTTEVLPKTENNLATTADLRPFLKEPIKGTENRPITNLEVENLSNISKVNGVDPNVKDSLVRLLTGKDVVGDLTNAEYIRVAKSLSTMNKSGEYAPGGEASLWTRYAGQYISPENKWADAVQRRTGVPLRDTLLDLKTANRFIKTTQDVHYNTLDNIFGKYADNNFLNERQLIDAHRHGDSSAITNNPNLTPEVKADLLKINDLLGGKKGGAPGYYDTAGPEFNLPQEKFKYNDAGYYNPDISDLGGVMERYKKGSFISNEQLFFAKQKKEGGMFVRINDPLVYSQIYARAGAGAKFMSDVLSRIQDDPATGRIIITKNGKKFDVPKEFINSFRSTVQEMRGYQDGLVKFLDDVTNRINNKLPGMNLPPDMGRRVNQTLFTYLYANALDSPGTAVRNLFTNEAFLYAKFGGENWFQVQKAFLDATTSKGGTDLWKEYKASGLGSDTRYTYGSDLGTIQGIVRNVGETLIKPTSMADEAGRFKAYVATKLKFENAGKLYNEGKLTWPQMEKKMGLNSISPIDSARIRQKLIAGDTKGAFLELARTNIEETNFPFTPGEGGRFTFGGGGKAATFLYKWQIHAAHTIGGWVVNGQWGNLIRYYGASAAIVSSMREFNGTDFSNSMAFGALNSKYPPSVQFALDLIQGAQKQIDDNAEAVDQNAQNITNSLKTFGMPGGVNLKNWQNFWAAYSEGPDADGKYTVRKPWISITDPKTFLLPKSGQAMEKETVYFHDLFKRLFGLSPETKTSASDLKGDILNRNFQEADARKQVRTLEGVGEYDAADALIEKWANMGIDISPSRSSAGQSDIPQVENMYNKLSPADQERFAPQFDSSKPQSFGEKVANFLE